MKPIHKDDLNKEMMAFSKDGEGLIKWNLIWEESFSLPEIDESKWNFVEGGTGFGNEESQYYTSRNENARIENGMLVQIYERRD